MMRGSSSGNISPSSVLGALGSQPAKYPLSQYAASFDASLISHFEILVIRFFDSQ